MFRFVELLKSDKSLLHNIAVSLRKAFERRQELLKIYSFNTVFSIQCCHFVTFTCIYICVCGLCFCQYAVCSYGWINCMFCSVLFCNFYLKYHILLNILLKRYENRCMTKHYSSNSTSKMMFEEGQIILLASCNIKITFGNEYMKYITPVAITCA